jgi:hypothetical protein
MGMSGGKNTSFLIRPVQHGTPQKREQVLPIPTPRRKNISPETNKKEKKKSPETNKQKQAGGSIA